METQTTENISRIAIQGGYGAFHEIAALHYFGDENIEILPRNTFKDLMKSLKKHQVDYGIMAIENSLAGSILPNYTLIKDSRMKIIGEIYLRIKQNLVALPGQSIADIKEVFSHPMAILQCQMFFDQYPGIKLIESLDTALSARDIKEKQLRGVGAISSGLAARKYELEILAPGIETNKMNYTRFLILKENSNGLDYNISDFNKASIHFALAHKTGSLSKILSILSYYDINLTKIQSMPIMGKDWEYQFYADLMFDDYEWYHKSIDAIRPFTSELGILGEYEKGKSIME
ncbi:MAG TPA: prephenate dehydratase [Bacteroidales bacterium]|nr:prephenate dehydratase [Bacteroidales bacterium]